ncbi:hypothetical protein WA026_022559 [Henosepilachna vigintioctopunctata]|uniref:PKD/REJ-like domain-containing protein n=1 Tax=Henosepilachna vigintioctopunctata TaxID=420089 RepID=A0AAW1VBW7_9CUCU
MRKMNILISFSTILFYFSLVENAKDPKAPSSIRDNTNCKSTIEFTNCEKQKKIVYRNDDLKMRTHFIYCEKHEYIFDYELVNQDTDEVLNYHNNFGPTLVVKRFTLDPGEYSVVLNVKLSNGDSFINTEYCQLSVLKASIFPIIRGGFERYVTAGNDIVLDASDSMDYTNQDPIDQKI